MKGTPMKKKVHRKVAWGGVAGAASVIVVWVVSLLGVAVPAEVASAFTTLLTFGVSVLKS